MARYSHGPQYTRVDPLKYMHLQVESAQTACMRVQFATSSNNEHGITTM